MDLTLLSPPRISLWTNWRCTAVAWEKSMGTRLTEAVVNFNWSGLEKTQGCQSPPGMTWHPLTGNPMESLYYIYIINLCLPLVKYGLGRNHRPSCVFCFLNFELALKWCCHLRTAKHLVDPFQRLQSLLSHHVLGGDQRLEIYANIELFAVWFIHS